MVVAFVSFLALAWTRWVVPDKRRARRGVHGGVRGRRAPARRGRARRGAPRVRPDRGGRAEPSLRFGSMGRPGRRPGVRRRCSARCRLLPRGAAQARQVATRLSRGRVRPRAERLHQRAKPRSVRTGHAARARHPGRRHGRSEQSRRRERAVRVRRPAPDRAPVRRRAHRLRAGASQRADEFVCPVRRARPPPGPRVRRGDRSTRSRSGRWTGTRGARALCRGAGVGPDGPGCARRARRDRRAGSA